MRSYASQPAHRGLSSVWESGGEETRRFSAATLLRTPLDTSAGVGTGADADADAVVAFLTAGLAPYRCSRPRGPRSGLCGGAESPHVTSGRRDGSKSAVKSKNNVHRKTDTESSTKSQDRSP